MSNAKTFIMGLVLGLSLAAGTIYASHIVGPFDHNPNGGTIFYPERLGPGDTEKTPFPNRRLNQRLQNEPC